jgi:NAD(P)-dependent dehydrogenase (short-subunit alcohol dehydrogenase family)
LDAAVAHGIEQFGKIDILIANAGVLHSKPYWEITEQEWDDVIDVNLSGAWHSAKAVARHMISRLTGTIVFTSSIRGLEPGMNSAHYVASKHGVLGLMKAVAMELAPYGVRVNAVLPSGVHTPMGDNPAERARIVGHEGATPDEYMEASRRWYALRGRTALPPSAIADAMMWLVSDEASHVTGIQLIVDGGSSLLPRANPRPTVA